VDGWPISLDYAVLRGSACRHPGSAAPPVTELPVPPSQPCPRPLSTVLHSSALGRTPSCSASRRSAAAISSPAARWAFRGVVRHPPCCSGGNLHPHRRRDLLSTADLPEARLPGARLALTLSLAHLLIGDRPPWPPPAGFELVIAPPVRPPPDAAQGRGSCSAGPRASVPALDALSSNTVVFRPGIRVPARSGRCLAGGPATTPVDVAHPATERRYPPALLVPDSGWPRRPGPHPTATPRQTVGPPR